MSTKKTSPTKAEIDAMYNPGYHWAGRSLKNYQEMQADVAAKKGVSTQLRNAKSLTEARKVVYGAKKGNAK